MPTCVGPCWDYSLTAVCNHCLGEYKLDTRLRRLYRRNDVVPLTPKAFDTCLHNSRNNRCPHSGRTGAVVCVMAWPATTMCVVAGSAP